MKLTTVQSLNLQVPFYKQLDALLAAFRNHATSQFEYNIETNVPQNILKSDEVVENALVAGFVGANKEFSGFGIEPSLLVAASILEDVNAHTEAAPLFAAYKKMTEAAS